MSYVLKTEKKKSFDEKIQHLSKGTQKVIKATNNSFSRFCEEIYKKSSITVLQDIKNLEENQLETVRTILQEWIGWQNDNGSLTSGIKHYISNIRRYFLHYGIKYHVEDFDEELKFKPRIKEELHALTLEEAQNIVNGARKKKGFYLALISTGARPGEILQVRKKDVDTSGKRIKIRIEAVNVKTRSGRSVYLTKEAGSYCITRLKAIEDNDLVWATNENPEYAERNELTVLDTLTDDLGYTERYKSNNYKKITLYSFRSYFFGLASDVHREGYAHSMIGHGGYLPQYDRMNDDKKLAWFLELEPTLTINDENRTKAREKKAEEEITELKAVKEGYINLKKELLFRDAHNKILMIKNFDKDNTDEYKDKWIKENIFSAINEAEYLKWLAQEVKKSYKTLDKIPKEYQV